MPSGMLIPVGTLLVQSAARLVVLSEDCAPGGCGEPNRTMSEYVMVLVFVVAGTCAGLALLAVGIQRILGAARHAGRANVAGWLLRIASALLIGGAVLVFAAKAAAFSAQGYSCVGTGRGVRSADGSALDSVVVSSDPVLMPGTRCALTFADGTTETVFSPWDTSRGAAVTSVVLGGAAAAVAQFAVGRLINRRHRSRALAGS